MTHKFLVSFLLGASLLGCGLGPVDDPESSRTASEPISEEALIGPWRAELASPGGPMPFGLQIDRDGPGLVAWVENADERAPLSGVEITGSSVRLHFDWFDSWIEARWEGSSPDGPAELVGTWFRNYPNHVTQLAFRAVPGEGSRFAPLTAAPGQRVSLTGTWETTFYDEDDESPARAEFRESEGRVTGTFLTPTGDYRFLEGSWDQGVLRLSTFDGAHAFLFEARGTAEGDLVGDFWSRDTYHATWTARRVEDPTAFALPDPWQQVTATDPDRRFRFAFEDLDGALVSADDPRFAGKVVVVNLFGSWCPNCNDEAPLLARWADEFAGEGLEIVGLAYEFSGEADRDRTMLRRFAQRHGITYPLLLAGTSDKSAAAATVPDLSDVLAYPTTLFIGRDGRIRRIHSGFAGPGTGEHHRQLVDEMTRTLRDLLAEPDVGVPSS